jgi:hypothetical protein
VEAARTDSTVFLDAPEPTDPEQARLAELRNIAHDLRGAAWSTEGLLRLLHENWDFRDEEERRRILKLALTQARVLLTLPPRLEQVYKAPPIDASG